jgi:hypothetical protein
MIAAVPPNPMRRESPKSNDEPSMKTSLPDYLRFVAGDSENDS